MAETLPPVIAEFDGTAEDLFALLDEIEERLEALNDAVAEPTVGLDDLEFDAGFDDVSAKLFELDAETAEPRVDLATGEFDAKIAEVEVSLAGLDAEQVTIDTAPASAALDELMGSLDGADLASGDLTGALASLAPVAESAAATMDEAAASAEAMAVSFDDAAGSTAALDGALGFQDLEEDLTGVAFAGDELTQSLDRLELSVLEVIDAAEDAGLIFDSLDELTNALGMDLSAGAVDATEFGEALSIALDNTAIGAQSAFESATTLRTGLAGVFGSAEMFAGGLDELNAEMAGVSLGTWQTWREAVLVAEDGLVDIEGVIVDLTGGIQDFEMALADIEGAAEDAEGGVQDLEEGFDVLGSAMVGGIGGISQLTSGFSSFFDELPTGAILIGGIAAALMAALPVAGALVGAIGALSAVGFTAFAGIGAFALGAVGDLGQLEDAAKAAFTAYQGAVEPFIQPIVNDAIPIITDALDDLIPVAQSAAQAIGPLVDELTTDMSSSGFEEFIEWVTANTGPAITTIADFAGRVTEALAEMGENGQPFINVIEQGLDSLGEDLVNFGDSNTFKDFVDWLVTNGPTVDGDLEGIASAFGKLFVALTPSGLSLLNDFEHTMTTISDVVDPVAHGVDEVTSSFDKLTTSLGQNGGGTSFMSWLGGGLMDVNNALGDGYHDLTSWTGGLSAASSATSTSTSLMSDYDSILKQVNIELDAVGDGSVSMASYMKAGETAANSAKTSWSSFGDAITAFASSTLAPTESAIAAFYTNSEAEGAQFTANIQKAITDGYSPTLIEQVMQAGPQEASQFLEGLVNAQGTGLANLINQATTAMTAEGLEAVQEARLTQEAIAAQSSSMTAQLSEALALSQELSITGASNAVAAVEAQFKVGLTQVEAVAKEYGIALSSALGDQDGPTALAATAQADSALAALQELGPSFDAAGAAMAAGIAAGLRSSVAIASVVSGAVGLVDTAVNAAKTAGQIHSPSQLFADEIGLPIAQGIARGIAVGHPGIEEATSLAIRPSLGVVSEGSPTSTSGISISIGDLHFGTGSGSIADQISAALPEIERQLLVKARGTSGTGSLTRSTRGGYNNR